MIAASVIANSGSTSVSGQALNDLVKSEFAPDPEHELQLIEQTELVESVAITLATVFAAVAAPVLWSE